MRWDSPFVLATAGTLAVHLALVTGGDVQSTLRVSVDQTGQLFVNGDHFTSDPAAVGRIREIAASTTKPKAIIAGDRRTAYAGVMHAIDLVQQAGVTAIALENERPATQ